MKKLFYILAVLLSVTWLVGFFILGAGSVIHCLLMMGVLFYLQAIISTANLKDSKASLEKVELA
jgi:hypothetical protein